MLFYDFKNCLRGVVERWLGDRPIALLFSGGSDSLSIFWTLLELDIEFVCYTFRLERVESDDIKAARVACRKWHRPLYEVIIPYKGIEELAIEIEQLVERFRTGRKTAIECIWPFTYIIPCIKEGQIWCGLNADDLWGSGREIAIRYSKDPQGFNSIRRKLIKDYYTSAWGYLERYCCEEGHNLISPYRVGEVVDYILKYSWEELNRPRQKMPIWIAFMDKFEEVSIWRKNDNLQCGSGVREYLARLLPYYNETNMGRLYRGLLKKVEEVRGQPTLI